MSKLYYEINPCQIHKLLERKENVLHQLHSQTTHTHAQASGGSLKQRNNAQINQCFQVIQENLYCYNVKCNRSLQFTYSDKRLQWHESLKLSGNLSPRVLHQLTPDQNSIYIMIEIECFQFHTPSPTVSNSARAGFHPLKII